MTQVAAPGSTRRASGLGAATIPATFIAIQTGNDVYWRVEAPARTIGAKVVVANGPRVFSSPNRGRVFPWKLTAFHADGDITEVTTRREWKKLAASEPLLTGMESDFPAVRGTAVFIRPDLERATVAKAMQRQGIRTVAETDDNYFCDRSLNIFLRREDQNPEMNMEAHARAMASMDANVFSTAWLRDRYYKEYRARFGKKGLPEMFVCKNNIARAAWPTRVERDGPLRVGFMGSPSHVWDVNLAYAAFHAAKQEGCETWMIGYNPADPEPHAIDHVIHEETGESLDLRSTKGRDFINKWAGVIDVHVPWIVPEQYLRPALPLDIGVAPLLSNDFTLGKSDVKAVEYTINGAACVLQNLPVYNSAGWKHERNCLMGGSYRELATATVRLIRDPKLRYELVSAAQEMISTERNEDVMRDEWMEAIA